jgi:rhodanese-related sulfurtransferase
MREGRVLVFDGKPRNFDALSHPYLTMDDTGQPDSQGSLAPSDVYFLLTHAGYTYIDVRDADEFEEGRPAGALNFPFSANDCARFVDAIRCRFQADSKLVVGCNSGKRSRLAARALVENGFRSIAECRTGWDGTRGIFGELIEPGWRRTGLPTENGSPTRS